LVAQLEAIVVLYALRRRGELSAAFICGRALSMCSLAYLESCVWRWKCDRGGGRRANGRLLWCATNRRHFPYLILSGDFQRRVADFRAALAGRAGKADPRR